LIRAAVIAPSYNNAGTLADVLTRVAALGLPIFLVNDGCTDATQDIVTSWQREHPKAEFQVLRHPRNRGKAAALKTGFSAAMAAGYTHAITIDTDGQHDPERIPALLDQAQQNPVAYVLGVRDDRHADYPARSRLGRRLSNLFIRLESGLKVSDSQCGLRVYPLELIRTVRCRAGRFGYEAEMITRAAWAGCPVVEVPINTRYLPVGERVSHFRPWWDSILGVLTHLRLVLREMSPVPHRKYRPRGLPLRKKVSFRDLLNWINPLRAWRELRGGEVDRNEFAAAMALGVFVANLPVYPCQTLLCLYLARRLHLNPLAAAAGAQISTPPIGILLIAGAICAGHLMLHGSMPVWPDFHSIHAIRQALGWPMLLDWAVGGVVVGFVCSAITFAIADWMFGGEDDKSDSGPPQAPERSMTGVASSQESF
jgi:glycosyltransferase involved in cell wall biosynthesis